MDGEEIHKLMKWILRRNKPWKNLDNPAVIPEEILREIPLKFLKNFLKESVKIFLSEFLKKLLGYSWKKSKENLAWTLKKMSKNYRKKTAGEFLNKLLEKLKVLGIFLKKQEWIPDKLFEDFLKKFLEENPEKKSRRIYCKFQNLFLEEFQKSREVDEKFREFVSNS